MAAEVTKLRPNLPKKLGIISKQMQRTVLEKPKPIDVSKVKTAPNMNLSVAGNGRVLTT